MVRRSVSAKRNSNMSEEDAVPLTKSESHEEEDIKDDDNEDEEEDDDDTEDEEEPSARGHPPHMTPVPVKDEDEDNEDDEEPSAPNTPSSGRPPHMTPVPVHIQPYYAFYPYPGMLPSGFPTSTGEFYSDASGMMDPPPDPRRNRGGVTEPFPEKLHRCLDSCERDGLSDVFSFFSHGRAFAIHKPRRFVVEIMPRFFRQTKLTSFQRQLNLYGFKRVGQGPDNGGYYHELFLKGRPGLCVNMKRTKIKGNAKGKRDLEGEPNFYAMPPVMKVPPPNGNAATSAPPPCPPGYAPFYPGFLPPNAPPYNMDVQTPGATPQQHPTLQHPTPVYPCFYPPFYGWMPPQQGSPDRSSAPTTPRAASTPGDNGVDVSPLTPGPQRTEGV